MGPLWSDRDSFVVLMFVLKFSTFEGKIEAPLTPVLSPGASIRENTVYMVLKSQIIEPPDMFCLITSILQPDRLSKI